MSIAEATSGKVDTQKQPGTPALTNLGRLLGAVGVVLLLTTPLTWLVTDELGVLVWGKLLLGVAFVGFYVATNADVFSRMAGARSTGLLVMSAVTVVVAFGLVGVVNFVAYKNPMDVDLTREGLYTLSDQTKNVLGRLQEDVQVYAFYGSADPDAQQVQEVLERYKEVGPKLAFTMVDPQSRPDLVETYGITERGARLVVTARGQDARAKGPTEEELTNAIIKVAEQSEKTVAFLTGHGEANIEEGEAAEGYKALADAIRAEGYKVQALNLLEAKATPDAKVDLKAAPGLLPGHSADDGHDHGEAAGLEVPGNIAVLVIAGARGKLMPPELAAIEDYLKKGGRVLALIDTDSDAGLDNLMRQWKIEAKQDLVVDTNPLNRMLGLGPAAPMVQPPEDQLEHPAVKALTAPVIFSASRSLEVAAGGQGGVDAVPLLMAGESAWGETNLKDGAAAVDEKDNLGPVALLIAATKKTVEPVVKLSEEGRLVVAGDSDWANNKYLGMQGNADMALNTLHWLAEEQERISIRPKTRQASQLFLSGQQMGQLKFFALDILPVLIVAMGLGIVLIRRQR